MKKFLISLPVFLFAFFGSVFFVSAMGISCPVGSPDAGKPCGQTSPYTSALVRCVMSGSDQFSSGVATATGTNRILGGQKCVIGGSGDFPGYWMQGTGEPSSNEPRFNFDAESTAPPGWSYSKTGNFFPSGNSIPDGEWSDSDPYNVYRFFGGNVTTTFPPADDESSLQVGSNHSGWTGCNSNGFRHVNDSSCPARSFYGSNSFNANPGDSIVFTVQNDLRPNNGYGQWGSGDASVTLNDVTKCYTAAYKTWYNQSFAHANYYTDVTDYHPTASGVCSPPPSSSQISFTCDYNTQLGNVLSWIVQGYPNFSIRDSDNVVIANGLSSSISSISNGIYTVNDVNGAVLRSATCHAVPILRAKWAGSGSGNPTVLVTPGSSADYDTTFEFWNSGGVGSTIRVSGDDDCSSDSVSLSLSSRRTICPDIDLEKELGN